MMMIEAPTEMNYFLMRYIDSYDVLTYSTNITCYFMIGVIVFLVKETLINEALGSDRGGSVGRIPYPNILLVCVVFCAITYVFNFLIQSIISSFFKEIYQQNSIGSCKTSLQLPSQYFTECVTKGEFYNLTNLAKVSFTSFLLACSAMLAWFVLTFLQYRNRRNTKSNTPERGKSS